MALLLDCIETSLRVYLPRSLSGFEVPPVRNKGSQEGSVEKAACMMSHYEPGMIKFSISDVAGKSGTLHERRSMKSDLDIFLPQERSRMEPGEHVCLAA